MLARRAFLSDVLAALIMLAVLLVVFERRRDRILAFAVAITPSRAPATAFAMLEAVFGRFYIAVVVAQLVSARMTGGLRQDSGGCNGRR
jgi:hypothetical protein